MKKLLLGYISITCLLVLQASAGDLTKFKTQAVCDNDPLMIEIKRDLAGEASVLELMRFYAAELKWDAGPDSPYLQKLEKLFMCGQAGAAVEGHFFGVPLVLKMGEHPHGDFLNKLWNLTLSDAAPWKAKTFRPITREELKHYTEGGEENASAAFLGMNYFKYENSLLNITSTLVLEFWLNLKDVSKEEKLKYGHDKKGGLFIAKKALSVDPKSPGKEVFQLNYRWKNLNNLPPVGCLIDEIVEIAEGLYLGKLVLARNIRPDYHPEIPESEYKYENYGYFLLWNDDWR